MHAAIHCAKVLNGKLSFCQRATATGVVISGFGLSAFFFSTIAHVIFPGDTSSFLLVLSIGTALPMVLGFFFVRIVPYQDKHLFSAEAAGSPDNSSPTQDGSRTPLLAEDGVEGISVRLTPSRSHSNSHEDASALGLAQASSQHLYDNEPLVDIHGKKMFLDPDYIVLFILFSARKSPLFMYRLYTCLWIIPVSGTGLMCRFTVFLPRKGPS